MRSKLLNITSRLLGTLIVIILTVVNSSCTDTETTDSTKFTIYYTGMTDIGPSMTGIISSPTYKGSTPYDFSAIIMRDENLRKICTIFFNNTHL